METSCHLEEGCCLQKHLRRTSKPPNEDAIARVFSRLMMQGKVKSAMNYLSQNSSGGVLRLEDMIPIKSSDGATDSQCSVHDILKDKHPPGKPPEEETLLQYAPESTNPMLFENLNADNIRQAAMQANGAAGLSGLDAYAWRRLCSSFGSASRDLCWALAMAGRRQCFYFRCVSLNSSKQMSRHQTHWSWQAPST